MIKPAMTKPEDVGMDPVSLNRVTEAVTADTGKGLYDGAVFIVARHGRIVLHEAVGKADVEKDRPAKTDDVFFIMSITKTFTTAAVLARIDRGEIALTTPVAEIIPEFGIKGKQRVTIAHMLTHTGGISGDLPPLLALENIGNVTAYVDAACRETLKARPGALVSYSPFTAHAILAELVCRLDGGSRPFRQILKEDFFNPLEMTDTSLGKRPDLARRVVPIVVRDRTPGLFESDLLESMNFLFTEETEIPGGGGLATAMDIFRWAEMLRNRGTLGDTRVLSPAIVQTAVKNHTGQMPNHIFDHMCEMRGWDPLPAYLGLSFFLRGEGLFPTPLGTLTSPGTFAGLGAGSTMFWVDPEKDLTFVCLTAGLLEEGASFIRMQRLSDLVVSSVVE
jgi:CubicO group peptidase (beta-lactamase class C family)